MEEKSFTATEKIFIDVIAEGGGIGDIFDVLGKAPYHLTQEQIGVMYRTPELLQAAIEEANGRLGQVWGSMWKEIKKKAALGSIQESKLLIDFVQDKTKIPFSKVRVTFAEDD